MKRQENPRKTFLMPLLMKEEFPKVYDALQM